MTDKESVDVTDQTVNTVLETCGNTERAIKMQYEYVAKGMHKDLKQLTKQRNGLIKKLTRNAAKTAHLNRALVKIRIQYETAAAIQDLGE